MSPPRTLLVVAQFAGPGGLRFGLTDVVEADDVRDVLAHVGMVLDEQGLSSGSVTIVSMTVTVYRGAVADVAVRS